MADSEKEPATLMVTRVVRPGQEIAYGQWLKETLDAARTFPNHLGTVVLTSGVRNAGVYRFVHLFADKDSLRLWESSDAHGRLSAEADRFSASRYDEATGMTAWFSVADTSSAQTPPKWKMSAVIFLVVYPLTSILIPLQAKWVSGSWPFFVTNALSNAILSVVMTYVLVPVTTKLLRAWLY